MRQTLAACGFDGAGSDTSKVTGIEGISYDFMEIYGVGSVVLSLNHTHPSDSMLKQV